MPFVQARKGASLATDSTMTTTTGNLLVAAITWDDTTPRTVTSVGDGTNNFTGQVEAKFVSANGQAIQLWYWKNITGKASATITAVLSGASSFTRIVVMEFSGCDPTAPLDKFTHGEDATSTPTTPSVTTTGNGEAIAAFCINDGTGGNTIAPGSGYTEDTNATASAGANEMEGEYQIQTSAGGITASWTISGSGFHEAFALATFKATASAVVLDKPRRRFLRR